VTLLTDEKRRLLAAAKLLRRGIDATHLERQKTVAQAPARRELPRLSFAQQRLWFLDRLEPANPFYNISGIAELEGPLEVATLARAFAEIARRHESLRTTFAEQDGVPYQVIAPPPQPEAWPLPMVDLTGLPAEAIQAETGRLALAEARIPLDLARGPLVRTTLIRRGVRSPAAAHTLLVTLHHIISDGWSNGLFLREMAVLYEAFAAGRPSPLPELPLQYADFAEQQLEELTGERLEREIDWWRRQLAGAPAVLDLPADRPRPPIQTFRGARRPLQISPERTAALHRLARGESATLFMVLLTAFGALLRSWTGEEDLTLGTPVANRRRPELEGIIGFFANTLALRLDLSGDPAFRAALGRVLEVAHGAYAHQDLPFEKLVEELQPERDLSRSPLFQVLAVLQNAPPGKAELSRLELRRPELDPGIAKLDLMLDLTELEGGLRGAFEYNTDLFEPATIDRLAERFGRLLEVVSAEPDRRLSEMALLPEAELRLLTMFSLCSPLPLAGEGPGVRASTPPLVLDLLEEQAERTPDAPAVVGIGGEILTYRELHAQANRLARHLLGLGISRGARVALTLDRSAELVISLLAILKAGAAYVPLDPSWPAERLAFLLEDSGAVQVQDLDRLDLSAESPLPPRVPLTPDDLAYVLYTSGSTGRPKGIAMRHGALAWLIGQQLASTPPAERMGSTWRTLQYTSPGFDVSFQEIVSTWAAGGTLVLISEEARRDPAALLARLRAERVGRLFLPFVALQQLAEAARGAALPESLREVITAGEQLRVTPAVAELFARLPGARLHNHYGPAETHVVTTFTLDGDPAAWPALPPIGRPVAGAHLTVADLDGRLAPVGSPGELRVGGALLARGYLDRPELTAERFVPDPFSIEPGARLYRTGDRVRWRPDGALEFLGRLDSQVKIRGYRVEPGEIEAVLATHSGVAAAAVVARDEGLGDRRLVAWVVPAGGAEIDGRALRGFLAGTLPDYLVPSAILSIDSLPLTPSGKVDRRALARRAPLLDEAAAGFVAPRTPTEEALAKIWTEVLGVPRAGATDHFFDLGGHSILATRVVARVQDAFGVELPLRVLFEAPVLADLAARIEREEGSRAAPWTDRLSAAPSGGRVAPASFGQARLWFVDRLEPGAATYNLPVALLLSGRLDAGALARTFSAIVRRHEALRTTFAEEAGEPFQVVHPADTLPPFALPVLDLAALPAGQARDEARRLGQDFAAQPFDLRRGPLLRAALFRLAPDEHLAVTAIHHIVSDGWSLGVLVQEVGILYGSFVAGLPSGLRELPVQYADYAAWQRAALQGEKLESQIRWWRKALEGAPQRLDIPADRPRPAVLSSRGTERTVDLPETLIAGLRTVGMREGSTLFMTLLAGYATVLGRWTGRDDLLIVSPVAGRTRPELEGLIGFFVNDLTLRCDLTGDPPFRELVRRLRGMTLGAFMHQDLPFERLVEEILEERSLSRHPLAQVAFAYQNTPAQALELPGLVLTPFHLDIGVAKLDLNLSLSDSGSTGPVHGVWEIATDLFDPRTIDRLSGHLLTLLAGAVAEPGRPLSELPLLTDAERAQLDAWNDTETTGTGETRGLLLQDGFLAWEARQPDAPAVIQDDRVLSYRQLRTEAERLARRLRALGVGAETRVAICLDETIERIVAVLGTLFAGGAWVPLDPLYPRERLAWMLEDSAASVILTREDLLPVLPDSPPQVETWGYEWLSFGQRISIVRGPALSVPSGTAISSPGFQPGAEARPADPDHLAYVIYTSGSTGRPNGVMIRHRSAAGFSEEMIGRLGLGPGDRMLQVVSFSFDATVEEIWGALGSGAALCIAKREARLSGEVLAEEIRRYGITVACLIPSLLAQLPEDGLEGVRAATVGGESCPAELANRWAPRLRLLNCYGPTEATVAASVHLCTGGDRREPPIGRPLAGVRLRVLDRAFQPVPVGVPGELWIAGPGLARGYQNQPGLTAERFLPDPFARQPGDRQYHTGDLVRLLPDGNLEFLGRLDHQVKIRGLRIELGEIEATLQAHPAVAEAAVVVRGGVGGSGEDRRLVAFAVPHAAMEPAVAELRAFLRDRLPEALVPASLVLLPALPRTPVGKIDRQALDRLAGQAARTEAPGRAVLRTPTERTLAEIWAELLGFTSPDAIGSRDSFFELGGHSLMATRLISRIRGQWGIELSLLAVFDIPVFEDLAARIARELRAGVPEVPPLVPINPPAGPPVQPGQTRRAPLSFAQGRLWFLDRLEPGSAAYNLPTAVRLAGRLDLAALAGSLDAIARRHESLRTTFEAQEEPRQVISWEAHLPLPVVDLSGLPVDRREAESERGARAEAGRPFDLERGPLARCLLVRHTPEEHVLVAVMHHIISDGWSMGVLVRELGANYTALREGRPAELPPLPVQYADFAVWQNGWLQREALELLGWWRQELEGAPQVLDLPTDRPRPPVQTFRGAEERLALPADLAAALRESGRREGATPFMVLLAGLHTLLGRWSGQRDLLIGAPVANRTRREVEPLIGFFVNTLVHRGRLGEGPSFRALLARTRTSTLGAFAHQDLPFERLVEELGVERSRSRTPLYQVLFALQNAPAAPLRLPGLTLEEIPLASGTARTDLVLALADDPAGGGIVGTWEHSTDLFDATTIRRLGRSFEVLLAAAVADPETPVAFLPLMPEEERAQVLVEWNQTVTDWPREASLGSLFAEQAARTPADPAVVWSGGELTWAELERRSARVARRLLARRVETEERVGLVSDRSPDLIAGLLGIVRAGGAYLPLDPAYPPERLAWMLEDAGARLLIAERRLFESLPAGAIRPGLEVLFLDEMVAEGAPGIPLPAVPPEALAYVMYTSGSTGTPKGVAVTHGNVIRLVRGADYADLGPEQVWLQNAPISFDASTLEIWAPLLNGGRLALAPPGRVSLDALGGAIRRHGVTALWLTAGLFHQMVDARLDELAPLRQLLAGGDVLAPEQVRRVLESLPDLRLINGYGPTEGTTFTCCHQVTDNPAASAISIPIGSPIANARVYVLDEDLQPVPPGVAGELYAGGAGLARGYLGRPELTAERFVPDPFTELAGERLYRTGDRVRWLPSGVLEFLGRLDGQVKVRGFRVETGEVEAVLASHPAVRQTAVMLRGLKDGAGGKVLTAWVTLFEPLPAADLQRFLRERLPEPMVPTAWAILDELPLTPNGKVDRRALPDPGTQRDQEGGEPRTPLERDIVELCAEVLGLEKVGIHSNFFDLGGHSLLATQLIVRLNDRLHMELPLSLIFETANLEELAEKIMERELAEVKEEDLEDLLGDIEGLSTEEMRELLAGGGEG
jgi:amino acid adenylation domain-containing protein